MGKRRSQGVETIALVVKGNLISRIHAKFEMRRGKFMLVDQSTNGTFLQNVQGQEKFVRRDSTELAEEGTIGLGRAEPPGSARPGCRPFAIADKQSAAHPGPAGQ